MLLLLPVDVVTRCMAVVAVVILTRLGELARELLGELPGVDPGELDSVKTKEGQTKASGAPAIADTCRIYRRQQ